MNDGIILHIRKTSFFADSRIRKETRSIIDNGLGKKIKIIALWQKGLAVHEELDQQRQIWRVPLKLRSLPKDIFSQSLKYCEWALKILFKIRNENIEIIHCHDLPALPIGIFLKYWKKSQLIYDAHELETETSGLRGIRKRMKKIYERIFIRFADHVLVVSKSIARWYEDAYPGVKRISVIMNVPYRKQNTTNRREVNMKGILHIDEKDILFIYLGAYVRHKGVDMLLRVFTCLDAGRHIVFMGRGMLQPLIEEYSKKYKNIHIHPAVHPMDVVRYTRTADIGIAVRQSSVLNTKYALPNKFFEYLISGVPVITNDFPEVGGFIDRYNAGWKVNSDKDRLEKNLLECIGNISKQEVDQKKREVIQLRDTIGWEKEEVKLIDVYESLLSRKITG